MATVKLVDFDHVTDYISREAAILEFCDDCIDKKWCKRNGGSCSKINNINAVPAADVRPVVRCKDCIHAPLPGDCEGNDMEWPKIDGIYEDCTCPHCCSDNWYSTRPDPEGFCEKGERRDPNLDTTKGEGRDESNG